MEFHQKGPAVRVRTFGIALAAATAALSVFAAAGASAAASSHLLLPSKDPFYLYTGKTPLSQIAPGTPLRERSVTLAIDTGQTPLPAEQILYRTTDATGRAVASVTTVLLPATGTIAPKVVGYLSFYDALGSQCDPSYTLRGGNPGSANEETAVLEQGIINGLRLAGYIVTVPDFEDETLDYVSGTESGMSSLDGIKATLAELKLPQATPIGLVGYSGGSIASDWASELAPHYAPKLHLVGVAEGGIPVDLAHNLAYINGSASWSDVIPAAVIGIARSYHIDLTPYLSSYGQKIVNAESDECIGQFLGAYPGLTVKSLVKPQYANVTQVPVFKKLFNDLIMGSVPGHPTEPLLMVAGNSDGTGDGVMIERDVQELAYEYCHRSVPVDFVELKGFDHDDAGVAFVPQAFAFLAERFAGAPAVNTCAQIQPGNSLAPIS
jgi:hypothetical protein